MIHCLNKVLTHTRNVSCFLFSTMSRQQAIDYHKAVLASRLIREVDKQLQEYYPTIQSLRKPDEPEVTPQIPLRQKFMNIIKEYQAPETETPTETESDFSSTSQLKLDVSSPQEEAKKFLLSYFIGGVWVHADYCSQQRFIKESQQYGKIKNFGEAIDQSHFPNQSQKQDYKKLVFCPTYLTTKQVFKNIKFSQKFRLLTGHFGIGKTYNFILYRLLSDIIFRYKYKYCSDLQNLPKQIAFGIPKLIYWSVNLSDSKQTVQKLIKRQCYELETYKPQLLKPQEEFKYEMFKTSVKKQFSLNAIYQNYGTYPILLVDQINYFASALRLLNLFQDTVNQKKKESSKYQNLKKQAQFDIQKQEELKLLQKQIQQEVKKELRLQKYDFQQLQKNATIIREIYKSFIKEFQKNLYLSSQLIQNDLLQEMDLNGAGKQQKITIKNLKYGSLLYDFSTALDVAEFVIFFFQKQFIQNSDKKQLSNQHQLYFSQMKSQLVELLKTNPILLSPKAIGEMLQESIAPGKNLSKVYESIKSLQKEQLASNLALIVQELTKQITDSFRLSLSEYLQKEYDQQTINQRRILMYRLLTAAQDKKIGDTSSELEVTTSDLFRTHEKHKPIVLQTHLYKTFFQYVNQKRFRCKVNQDIIIQVLGEREKQFKMALLKYGDSVLKLVEKGSTKGGTVESAIITLLSTKGTNFVCYATENNIKKQWLKFIQMEDTQKLNQLFFKAIPQVNSKQYLNFKFLESFKSKLENLSVGNYLFIPQKSNKEQSNQISKSIDFIIVKKSQLSIYITAFDPTVEYDKYQEKILKFLKQFTNFKDKNQTFLELKGEKYSVALDYVVLCPETPPSDPKDKIKWQDELNQVILKKKEELSKQKEQILIERLKQEIKNLKSLNLKNENYFSFNVKFKTKNKQSLLRRVSVCSLMNASFANNDTSKDREFELGFIERVKADMSKALKKK